MNLILINIDAAPVDAHRTGIGAEP
jgi:hypothetical protein